MIVHISHKARGSAGITQGLLACQTPFVLLEHPYVSLGKTIVPQSDDKQVLAKATVIFCHNLDPTKQPEYFKTFTDLNLWDRIIFYDFGDSQKVNWHMAKRCRATFKRSVTNRRRELVVHEPIKATTQCALDEYYLYSTEKRFDVGCFFGINKRNKRRCNLLTEAEKWGWENSLIGISTGGGSEGRAGYQVEGETCFSEYMRKLNQCRVILTAQPDRWEGDNRTWEAMASGALVVMDRMHFPYWNPLEDEKHCLLYDSSDLNSIHAVFEKVDWYLKNEKHRAAVAAAGYKHVQTFHRPRNRVMEMLIEAKVTVQSKPA